MLFLQFVILIAGFVFLIKGADFFVDGSSKIAKAFHIPSVIIGLTIVSMGTSLPELAVSVTSAINKIDGIAIGNVVGSNIVNLMLVAGLTATIIPISVEKSIIKKDLPFSMVAALAVLLLISDRFFSTNAFSSTESQNLIQDQLTRSDGLILILIFSIYIYSLISYALDSQKKHSELRLSENNQSEKEINFPIWKSAVITILGLAGIIAGGQMTVNSASFIAKAAGMSDRLIGLTIVAFGTSLPELITSLVAASHGENDIAIGNVVGSNIFNILFILGFAATLQPMQVENSTIIDITVLLFCSLFVLLCSAKKLKLTRITGIFMVLIYAAYNIFIFIK